MPVHRVAERRARRIDGNRDRQQRQHIEVVEQTLDGVGPGRRLAREVQMAVERRDVAVVLAQRLQRLLALCRESAATARTGSGRSPRRSRSGAAPIRRPGTRVWPPARQPRAPARAPPQARRWQDCISGGSDIVLGSVVGRARPCSTASAGSCGPSAPRAPGAPIAGCAPPPPAAILRRVRPASPSSPAPSPRQCAGPALRGGRVARRSPPMRRAGYPPSAARPARRAS